MGTSKDFSSSLLIFKTVTAPRSFVREHPFCALRHRKRAGGQPSGDRKEYIRLAPAVAVS